MPNKIIPYNPILKQRARELRKNSTLSEILLWQQIKRKSLGVQFHRQVPIANFIVDFYCHELQLAIEIDGCSHDYKYEYDTARQRQLEDLGVSIIRFDDLEVKQNMNNILVSLEVKIAELSAKNF